MIEHFTVESRDPGTSLTLRAYDDDYVIAEIAREGLHASARVTTYLADGFGDFFASLARGWRGWTGTLTWSSLEHELELEATSDRSGHVFLAVALRRGGPVEWRVKTELVLEAGRLDRLAAEAQSFTESVMRAT